MLDSIKRARIFWRKCNCLIKIEIPLWQKNLARYIQGKVPKMRQMAHICTEPHGKMGTTQKKGS